jgi:7-carboxy-7-deazaguanine synthase
MSVDEVIAAIVQLDHQYVVLTGGEPMLFSELVPLCDKLREMEKHITIETAGTLSLPVECDLMSLSPKLSNSTPLDASKRWLDRHEKSRHVPDVIRYFINRYPYQMKFVVGDQTDGKEVLAYLEDFPEIDRDRVMLMPEGTTLRRLNAVEQWLQPFCADHDLIYCPRRQIEWFGAVRGT